VKNTFYIRAFVGFIQGEIVAMWRRIKTIGQEVPLIKLNKNQLDARLF
jgi:hypothetical protein